MENYDVDEIFNFLLDHKLIIDIPPICKCGHRCQLKTRNDSADKF
jgi:hypothetical protein